ncbi:MAG TPA: HAD-IIIC family phosphatase [Dongiaceae bacterium]|nr:HAD-IIIC family phosphatase [Dongiaceae bacterium]
MKNIKYTEILKRNRLLATTVAGPACRIGVLSNIVVNQLGEVLEYCLRSRGINATVEFGNYDNITQDAARLSDCNVVIVFWEIADALDGFHANSHYMPEPMLIEIKQRLRNEIDLTLSALRSTSLVLFNAFTALPFTADELRASSLDDMACDLTGYVRQQSSPNVLMIETDRIIAATGLAAAVDWRQYQMAHSLYAIDFYKAYATHVTPAIASLMGKARKVLVLDCDNTLWGGVLGEDGEDGIQIGGDTPSGRAFQQVQAIVKGLQKDGVILALCSKNNPEDVETVLQHHPNMVLRDTDFAVRRVNWEDKAGNLMAIAAELNLGLDSLVFLDDSEFELGLVRAELPMVYCVKVPTALTEYAATIRQMRALFFSLSQSAEDRQKTRMYQQAAARRQAETAFTSLEDYLRSLHLQITIMTGQDVPLQRAAQLTQKTNQFNVTTRRYTETDISRFIDSPVHQVIAFSVADRFGDYGIVGLAIIELDQTAGRARLDTFLMSCRVLGRNVETAFFQFLRTSLGARGINTLEAEFFPTTKNAQVASLFEQFGFELTDQNEPGGRRHYVLDPTRAPKTQIDYIEVKAP